MVPQEQLGCQHTTSICLQPLQPTGTLHSLDPSSWPYKILQSISPPAYGIWEPRARFQGRFNLPQCADSNGCKHGLGHLFCSSALWNLWPNLKIRGKTVLNQKNEIKFSHVVSFCKKRKRKILVILWSNLITLKSSLILTHTHTQKKGLAHIKSAFPHFFNPNVTFSLLDHNKSLAFNFSQIN